MLGQESKEEELRHPLDTAADEGPDRTAICRLFGRNLPATASDELLAVLLAHGRYERVLQAPEAAKEN